MAIEGQGFNGSMYGAVDSLVMAGRAMEELLAFLPADFMWPTNIDVSPGIVTIEWSHEPLRGEGRITFGDGVWLKATTVAVTMHAMFHQEYPHLLGVDEEFKAETMAALLLRLTKDWEWTLMEDGTPMYSRPTAKRLPNGDV